MHKTHGNLAAIFTSTTEREREREREASTQCLTLGDFKPLADVTLTAD